MGEIINVTIEDNTEAVLEAMQAQVNAWLEAIGEDAATTSAQLLARIPVVDTGRLMNSIDHSVDESENAVYIGTNVEYAIYHEFGTGEYASGGSNAKKIPWAFQDKNGEWHYTKGVKARHFLQFGATAHKSEYKALLEQYLKS